MCQSDAVLRLSPLTLQDDLDAIADFCLIPFNNDEDYPSVSKYIAGPHPDHSSPSFSDTEGLPECQRVLEESGLKYELHGYGVRLSRPLLLNAVLIQMTDRR